MTNGWPLRRVRVIMAIPHIYTWVSYLGIEQVGKKLVAGADDLARGAETGGGDDQVDEFAGEIDVALFEGAGFDGAGSVGGCAADEGRAAVGAGVVEIVSEGNQAVGVIEIGEDNLTEGFGQTVGELAGDIAVSADGECGEASNAFAVLISHDEV